MTYTNSKLAAVLLCSGALLTSGCAKKVAIAKPPASAPTQANATPATQVASVPVAPRTTAPAPNRPQTPDVSTSDRIQALLDRIQDAYFDYNTASIRKDAQTALFADATALSQILRQYPSYKLTVEGFCDERGSSEFNLALGDSRAKRARDFLVETGVPAVQIQTESFGKEQQACTEHDEACWQKNRRVHIVQAHS